MKTRKNKKGISLIVLVITIIVMIILAAAIIISISNSGIVNRANEAVEKTTEAQMEQMVTVGWAEAHLKDTTETKDDAYYLKEVKAYLTASGITESEQNKYIITATTQGVSVKKKDVTPPTVTIAKGEVTAFTIKVNVTATDSETGIKEYRYYIKKDSETEYVLKETSVTSTYTFEGLDYTATYDVKVEVEDDSDNTTTVYSEDIVTAAVDVTTLGALVTTAADYGDTVNYSVTVNENVIDDWKVFYKQTVDGEDYVYLITSGVIPSSAIPTTISNAIITDEGLYWEQNTSPASLASGIINTSRWLIGWWGKYGSAVHAKCSSYYVDERCWTSFKNTATYGDNVVGAIGSPTAEMFVASWNAKRALAVASGDTTTYNVELSGTYNTNGYWINSGAPKISPEDELYVGTAGTEFVLATPMGVNSNQDAVYKYWYVSSEDAHYLGYLFRNIKRSCRPVVCLNANTAAYAINDTSIGLVAK